MLEELYQIMLSFKQGLVDLLPKLITSLVVLILGYLFAQLVKYLLIKLMRSLGGMISKRFKNIELKEQPAYVGTVFFWLILLATFLLITDILGLTILTAGIEGIIKYTPNILAAILILLAANILSKIISDIVSSVSTRVGFADGNTLGKIVRVLILLTAIIIVVDQLGIEVTFLIYLINIVLAAFLFSAALAFGLGARTSFSNILASFYVRKLYKEGDLIKINGVEGRIVKIEASMVILDTVDGRLVIPAKEFNETKSLLVKKNN